MYSSLVVCSCTARQQYQKLTSLSRNTHPGLTQHECHIDFHRRRFHRINYERNVLKSADGERRSSSRLHSINLSCENTCTRSVKYVHSRAPTPPPLDPPRAVPNEGQRKLMKLQGETFSFLGRGGGGGRPLDPGNSVSKRSPIHVTFQEEMDQVGK